VSATTTKPEIVGEDIDKGLRRGVAIVTWIIILFIPVYSKTVTYLGIYGPITEKTYIWPWMILTHYTLRDIYASDQYAVVAFPWSFILFIPFLYAFKSAWMVYKSNEQRIINSAQIIIASMVQYFLILMTFKSQNSDTPETVTTYYVPQLRRI
jgi:hypothetical protein